MKIDIFNRKLRKDFEGLKKQLFKGGVLRQSMWSRLFSTSSTDFEAADINYLEAKLQALYDYLKLEPKYIGKKESTYIAKPIKEETPDEPTI